MLERWRDAGSREGAAARDHLRDGVEAALAALGSGFLAGNPDLRQRVQEGDLPLTNLFGQLLRLVYRLIFLLVAEDRGLLHAPDASATGRLLYAKGYSLASLRDRAVRRMAWDGHHDKWEGLAILFTALSHGEKRLGLPPLGGLFAPDLTPDLDRARISNRALMEAIFRLAWLRQDAGLVPVNWRDMETEELGSVYESLLELTPRLTEDGRAFAFAEGNEAKGHARKTSGSYYTPNSLVQALLDTALNPVLEQVEREAEDPRAALLGITVIDPACGSGHFLLAAGRRIATRVARARSGGVASADDYRRALRDVTRACLHGVDRNPMAVELTKVALWIETVEPGKPLGFLDANIRCGDALLGVFDLKILETGIPDAAYKPLTGDDKATAKYYAVQNRDEARGQGTLDFARGSGRLTTAAPLAQERSALRALPEDNPEQVDEKRRRFEVSRNDQLAYAWSEAADLFIAAFLLPKVGGPPGPGQHPMVPTNGDVWRALAGTKVHLPLLERAIQASHHGRAFHWPLEFPDVIAAGGFDVAVGNPPWERIKLQEQEFFAALDSEIATAPTAAARGKLIAALAKAEPGTREHQLHIAFETAKRLAEASSIFARESGRFPLAGRGDVNTYALFGELFSNLVSLRGRAGAILPTGIATEATTSEFFGALVKNSRVSSLFDFENRAHLFSSLHTKTKFCLMTISYQPVERVSLCFMATTTADLADPRKTFSMSGADIGAFNPNSLTVAIFRSRRDAEVSAKIYDSVPIFMPKKPASEGLWRISFGTLFHMSNDSEHFIRAEKPGLTALYRV